MRKHESGRSRRGSWSRPLTGTVPGEADQDLPTREDGKVSDLVLPVATLIGVTLVVALWIGISSTDGAMTPMQVLANTDVIIALFYGGLAACVALGRDAAVEGDPGQPVAGRPVRRQVHADGGCGAVPGLDDGRDHLLAGDRRVRGRTASAGAWRSRCCLPSCSSWPRFISFSMGSTFGTFGLILPIAAEIVVSVDLSLLIPAFGAVLAGAIFGDHTSPLSDTTILSSIGSGIHLMDHVTTQLPYALVCCGVRGRLHGPRIHQEHHGRPAHGTGRPRRSRLRAQGQVCQRVRA